MTIKLCIISGKRCGKTVKFTNRTTCIIGRSPECTVQLPSNEDHSKISRYHCLLDINPPALRIRDFGSLNGTYVNGKKIGQRARDAKVNEARNQVFPEIDLQHGDAITVGCTVLRVEVIRQKASQSTQNTIPKLELTSDLDCLMKSKNHSAGLPPSEDPDQIIDNLMKCAAKGPNELVQIKGYEVTQELGKGAMGAVYLAKNNSTGEEMALKLMLPQVANNETQQALFLREIESTRTLKHPNIVKMLGSGHANNMFFLTLEYCNAGSIDQLKKKRGGTLSIDEAVPLILDALDGLVYAHAAGFIHRDIKPANIYLSTIGNRTIAKLGDLGLAKSFDDAGLGGLTITGASGGTPVFMPRQQALNYKYAKPEVDVWAMAATLYNMLTGVYPRHFRKHQDPWMIILKEQAIPIRDRNKVIPAKLAEVIDRALVDKPEIGIKDAAELKHAIEAAL